MQGDPATTPPHAVPSSLRDTTRRYGRSPIATGEDGLARSIASRRTPMRLDLSAKVRAPYARPAQDDVSRARRPQARAQPEHRSKAAAAAGPPAPLADSADNARER